MKGSEKQIEWAKDITNNVLTIMDATIKTWEGMTNNPNASLQIASLTKYRDALLDCESARAIIEVYKDVKPTGNIPKDFSALASRFRICVPNGEAERKLLCR